MSKISFLKISNFLGIDEQELETSKINIFRGPKGKELQKLFYNCMKSIKTSLLVE